jgi:putative endonuclease
VLTKASGNWGENFACKFLVIRGYKIIERNFRTRFGEIDIIAVKNDVLSFVEVKTRLSKKFGKPEEAVTKQKLKKIFRVGEYYCHTHNGIPKKIKVEVVAIEVEHKKVASVKLISAI